MPAVVALFWWSTFASALNLQCDDAASESPSLFNAEPPSNLHYKPSAHCKF